MNKSIKKTLLTGGGVIVVVFASMVYSHCQIPCGIYDDEARFGMISEHITTIEKSMKLITALSAEDNANMNQIVRWIQNKEKHADDLSHILTHYFMAQRLKPVWGTDGKQYDEYVNKLTLLHKMLVYSMKTKQTTSLDNIKKLRSLLSEFHSAYFSEGGSKR